jgi:hypothetical protein
MYPLLHSQKSLGQIVLGRNIVGRNIVGRKIAAARIDSVVSLLDHSLVSITEKRYFQESICSVIMRDKIRKKF